MSKLVVTITLVCVLRDVVVVASPRDIRNHFHLRASSHRRLATHEKDLKKKRSNREALRYEVSHSERQNR